jgi:tryptophan-rich sensory protein
MDGIDWTLMGFIAVNFAAAMSGAVFKPGPWYETLAKPSWNPPNWAFPLVWTILFAMIAVAGWLAWDRAGGFRGAPLAFLLYGLQLALNAGWSAIFFGMKRADLALIEVGGMWLAIVATTVAFFQIDAAAGWMMVPYLLWTSVAARLNHKIMQLNPQTGPLFMARRRAA